MRLGNTMLFSHSFFCHFSDFVYWPDIERVPFAIQKYIQIMQGNGTVLWRRLCTDEPSPQGG